MYENPAAVAAEEDTLAGIVDTIIYQNGENGYVVFGMEDTTGAMVTVTGVVPYLSEGDTITGRGLGAAIPFALELIRTLLDEGSVQRIAEAICWKD